MNDEFPKSTHVRNVELWVMNDKYILNTIQLKKSNYFRQGQTVNCESLNE